MKTFISIIIPFLFISSFAFPQETVIASKTSKGDTSSVCIHHHHSAYCYKNTLQNKEKITAPENNIDRVISILKLVGTLMGVLVALIAILITIAGVVGFFRWDKIVEDAKQSAKKVKEAERIVEPIMERLKQAEKEITEERKKMQEQPPAPLDEKPSDELKKQMAEYGEKIKLLEMFGMPLKAEDYFNKGAKLYYANDYKSALIAYEKTIELKPDDAMAWHNKSITLGKLNRPEEALKSYEKAIELKPDYAMAWYNKGITLSKLNRVEEALKAFEKAIELKPDYAEAWNNKGATLNKLNRPEEALKAYEKAIELKPEDALTWNNKGITLGKLNRVEEALKAFEKAIELKPDDASPWFNKACIYALKGDKENALINLSQAVKFDVADKEKAKKDEDFKNLWNDPDFKKLVD